MLLTEYRVPKRRSSSRQSLFAPVQLRVESLRIPVPAVVIDLSTGGRRIAARMALGRYERVVFTLARDEAEPLRLSGIIYRVRYNDGERMFHYGVAFEGESDELAQFIAGKQQRTNNPCRERP